MSLLDTIQGIKKDLCFKPVTKKEPEEMKKIKEVYEQISTVDYWIHWIEKKNFAIRQCEIDSAEYQYLNEKMMSEFAVGELVVKYYKKIIDSPEDIIKLQSELDRKKKPYMLELEELENIWGSMQMKLGEKDK